MLTPRVPRCAARVLRIDASSPVIVVGDIHGRLDLLDALLGSVPADATVIVAGDVCDRGPDTRGCLERLLERRALGVIGNHDIWFLDWLSGAPADEAWLNSRTGGLATLASYGLDRDAITSGVDARTRVPKAHVDWLSSLPVAIDLVAGTRKFWIMHGGVPSSAVEHPNWNSGGVSRVARENPTTLVWGSSSLSGLARLDRPQVVGHQHQDHPVDLGHVIALDCSMSQAGAGLGGVLLPDRVLIAVSASNLHHTRNDPQSGRDI